VAHVDSRVLKVSIIPHTRDETTLLDKAIGEIVNIECDVVAKYIERLINFNAQSTVVKNDLSADFLARHGFIK
jgi:riboflavin synthase